jgi:ABC-type dipeptide/oligopeptide/nickel transport system ATPase component
MEFSQSENSAAKTSGKAGCLCAPTPQADTCGCAFVSRCPEALERCCREKPEPRIENDRMVRCFAV